LMLRGGRGRDVVEETTGIDTVFFGGGLTRADILVQRNATTATLTIIGTSDSLVIPLASPSQPAGGIERFMFSDGTLLGFNDFFVPTELADNLVGGSGADHIDALGGDDTVDGATGNDVLLGGAGNDVLLGGTGDDDLEGGVGNDALTGDLGNDTLLGGAGEDNLTPGLGNDFGDPGRGDALLSAVP